MGSRVVDFSAVTDAVMLVPQPVTGRPASWPTSKNAAEFAHDGAGAVLRFKPSGGLGGYGVVTGQHEHGAERLSVVEQCTHIPTVVGTLSPRSTASTMVSRFSLVFRPLALQQHGITSRGFSHPPTFPP